LEPVSQNLGDNLIDDIAKTDGYEMIDCERTQLFGYKSNESMVVFLQKMILIKEIPNTVQNNRFHNAPIFLIEQGGEAIWDRSFGSTNTSKSIKNFLFRRNCTQRNIIFWCDLTVK
jgi:hypothetical protein